ncbi:MAG TPA: universal stress protein [Terracidiphilus sp.]|nr:universal stress protein [Terracidiphilus sp.]
MVTIKHGWTKPATILFATECPANEKAFSFALAQAMESGADLILFHVYDGTCAAARKGAAPFAVDYTAARDVKDCFEPLVRRATDLGIACRTVVRSGLAAEEILGYLNRHPVDRLVMGVHTPGPVGKLLVGSVAETVLRKADVPVTIVGPYLVEDTYRNFTTRTILCSLSPHPSSRMVARLAAELAEQKGARLVLQQVIPPQECTAALAGRDPRQLEADLVEMIPPRLLSTLTVQARVMVGDPTEELLYQSRVLEANLIVMGAHDASHFAAVTHASVVYKVPAYARCPVMTLSPVMLAGYGPARANISPAKVNYIAGVL